MKNKRGVLAIGQISLLVFSIISIGFVLGEINFVSGVEVEPTRIHDSLVKEGFSPLKKGFEYKGDVYQYVKKGATKNTFEIQGEIRETISLKDAQDLGIVDVKGEIIKDNTWWGGVGRTAGTIFNNAKYGALIYGGVKFVLGSFVENEKVVNSLAEAGGAGYFLGKTFGGDFKNFDLAKKLGLTTPVFTAITIAVVFALRYKREAREVVSFSCYAWDAPTKGNDCEKCNQQGELPCSEYQCRSLGQNCELINKGTTEELCIWRHENDIKFPTIQVWEDALLDKKDYSYEDQDTGISPPDRGVRINYAPSGGCVKAFTPFSFGVALDEPGHCKLDIIRKDKFEDMFFEFSNGLSRYNHSYTLSLPGTSALQAEEIEVQNDGEYEVYVKCMDANENVNPANFVFKYCVQKGPDTTPPLVVSTSVLDEHPVGFGQDSVPIIVYTNEPATCKWTRETDKSYTDMEEKMINCGERIEDANDQMLYECSTTLTGIKDRQRNNFYIRCKDQPLLEGKEDEKRFRNEMRQGHKLTIIGTQPLVIDSVLPNGTIKDSTDIVKVVFEAQTSAGYDEGKSVCSYKESGDQISDYIEFENTDSHKHSQNLWFEEGDYSYDISCEDLGGNSDNKTINFHVETDTEPPVVVRAFKEELNLRIITNEEAECVYSTSSSTECNYLFEPDGLSMITTNDVNHFVEWNPNTNFYIKCQDQYGNQPQPPNECSIIVKPFEIS